MKTIEVRTLPHAKQRYDTVGDYEEVDYGRAVAFRISAMPDWRSEAAVAVHELIEYFLVKRARVKLEDIDMFDLDFEARRGIDFADEGQEPGNDPAAPYFRQHQFAEIIERLVVKELGMTWAEHEGNVDGIATVGLRSARPRRAERRVRGGSDGVDEGADRHLRDGPGAPAPGSARGEPADDRPEQSDGDRETPG